MTVASYCAFTLSSAQVIAKEMVECLHGPLLQHARIEYLVPKCKEIYIAFMFRTMCLSVGIPLMVSTPSEKMIRWLSGYLSVGIPLVCTSSEKMIRWLSGYLSVGIPLVCTSSEKMIRWLSGYLSVGIPLASTPSEKMIRWLSVCGSPLWHPLILRRWPCHHVVVRLSACRNPLRWPLKVAPFRELGNVQ